MNFTAGALGTNIQMRRKEAKLTQADPAARLHVSFQTVSKWENGKSGPDALILPVLAEIFSCSIDDLFSDQTCNRICYNIPSEFVLLWRMIERQWLTMEKHMADKDGKQILAMLSPDDNAVFMFVNQVDHSKDEEDMLYDMKREHTQVDRILCMWSNGAVDLPSYHFRKGLLEVNPENKNAQILLMGGNGFSTRTLESTMP